MRARMSLAVRVAGLALLAALPVLAAEAAQRKAGAGGMPPAVGQDLAEAVAASATLRSRGTDAGPKPPAIRADVVLHAGAAVTRADLAATGARVRDLSLRYGRASVEVADRATLERLAALRGVRMLRRDHGYLRRAGAVTSRAVQALNVDAINAGTSAELTGDGVTIGILSDSLSRTTDVVDGDTTFDNDSSPGTAAKTGRVTMRDSRPQDSGDLPAQIEILQDDADGGLVDEGAAMAELIHDIAPGARLFFHTAVAGGLAGFAAAIDDLCDPGKGVDIVVDDIGFLAELMYQRDVLSQAVEACVERGVAFFSAAGNAGERALRVEFDDLGARDDGGRDGVFPVNERDFHDWNGGDRYLRLDVPANSGVTVVLQWNQPALSVPANTGNGPRIDLDLLAFGAPFPDAALPSVSSFLDQQADTAADGQDPVEIATLDGGSTGATYYLAVDHWAGAQERIPQDSGTRLEFRLVFFERGSATTIEYLDTGGGPDAAPSMYGHTVATGVQSVGAVPWFDAGPFRDGLNPGPTARTDPEPFTARGGALERHFRPDGTFRRATQPPQPAIAATDANNTTFFGRPWGQVPGVVESEAGEPDQPNDFPNFVGTSAAAPNAAAVAALLLEADGSLTPGQLAARLQAGAIDVDGAGAAVGCDARTGSGLVDADAALTARDRPPTADAGDDQRGEDGDTITLDGSASSDKIGIETYRWRQVAGPRVSLSNPGGAQTEFRVPDVDATLAFELRVTDAACLSDADRVEVSARGDGGGGAIAGLAAALGALFGAARWRRRAAARASVASRPPAGPRRARANASVVRDRVGALSWRDRRRLPLAPTIVRRRTAP